jgi:ubiquinone biosynthesis protein
LLELATVRTPANEDVLERALAQFMVQHLGPGMVPDASMFNSLFRLLVSFGLVFQPVIGAVFRTMMTLEGTLIALSPGFDMVAETRDMAGTWLGQMLSPASLREAATDEALGLLPVLRKLPRRLDRIAGLLEHGGLTASMRVLANESDRRFVGALVGRAVLAFLGATLGIMSVMLIGIHGGPTFFPGTSLFHVLGYVGLFFSTVLILRVVIAISREGI